MSSMTANRISLRAIAAYLMVGFFVALQFVLQGSVSLMVPELKADLGLQEAGVGMLSSLFFYPYVLLQIPAGRLLSLISTRTLLVLSGLLMFSGCVIQATAVNATVMMLGRMVMGIGAAPGIVCFLNTVERYFPVYLFGVLAAGMEVFGMIGAGLSDFLIPESIASWGWRDTLKIFAVLSLFPVIGSLFLLTGNKNHSASESDGSNGEWKKVFKNTDVWLVAVYSGLMFAVINAFAALWAIPFLDVNPTCAGQAGSMVGMIFLGTAVGAPVLGWLADHRLDSRVAMMVCAVLTMLLFLVVLSDWLPRPLYYPVMFTLGLCASSYMLPFILVKHWLRGEQLSIGLALTNTVSVMIGALFYQPLIGWLIGFYPEVCLENYRQVLLIIPLGLAVGGYLAFSLRTPSPTTVPMQMRS